MISTNQPKSESPAVILLSGGLDSATTAAIARQDGYELYALSVDYGQRHHFELEAARRVAQAVDVCRHVILDVDLGQLGGSALTDALDVPKDRPADAMSEGIPVTYVPARNTVLLSLALAFAETVGAADIFVGVNAVDYSGYPDCRPEYIEAFQRLANLATKAGVEGQLKFTIHAPLIHLTKAQIIRRGTELGVDYALTHTCYDPDEDGISCGRCDACQLRRKGFAEAGLRDPLPYRTEACRLRKSADVIQNFMRIAEIFRSLQGEGRLTGVESVFVRTSGCNLRCRFCDTRYTSWEPEGDYFSVEEVLAAVEKTARARSAGEADLGHVVVTGGEPMLLPELVPLCAELRRRGMHITIETAGTRYQPVECDLMAVSPKLSNSTPHPDEAPEWIDLHERNRAAPMSCGDSMPNTTVNSSLSSPAWPIAPK